MATNKRTVGIVDSDAKIIGKLRELMLSGNLYEPIFSATDGRDALAFVLRFTPDILIIDDVLPHHDGLEVVRILNDSILKRPYVIFTSYISNPVFINRAILSGAGEFCQKPYDPESMIRRIEIACSMMSRESYRSESYWEDPRSSSVSEDFVLYQNNFAFNRRRAEEARLNNIICDLLLHVGCNIKQRGFQYIVLCVKYMYLLRNRPCFFSKDIYPQVAAKFNVSNTNVEHNIRNAINHAWNRYCKGSVLLDDFYYGFEKKPSNVEFIQMVSRYVQSEMEKFNCQEG